MSDEDFNSLLDPSLNYTKTVCVKEESFILITYSAESKSISKPFSDVLKN
jgi:hypothetical protein